MSSLAHFTGVLYTPAWGFLCLFFSMAVEGLNSEQADVSTHVFLFVVSQKLLTRSQQGVQRATLECDGEVHSRISYH